MNGMICIKVFVPAGRRNGREDLIQAPVATTIIPVLRAGYARRKDINTKKKVVTFWDCFALVPVSLLAIAAVVVVAQHQICAHGAR